MLFTPSIHPTLPDIMFNGVVLEWTDHMRYLGVILDNKLSFDPHISSVYQKLNKDKGALLNGGALNLVIFPVNQW